MAMIRKRVSSPSAAKIGAALRTADCFSGSVFGGFLRRDMAFDVLDLNVPAAAVHAKRIEPARLRNLVEARLDHCQQRAAFDVFQLEDDQCGWLLRVIDGGVDCSRMPAPRQEPLRLE